MKRQAKDIVLRMAAEHNAVTNTKVLRLESEVKAANDNLFSAEEKLACYRRLCAVMKKGMKEGGGVNVEKKI